MTNNLKITSFMEKIGLKKLKKNESFKNCSNNFQNKMPLFIINCDIHKNRLDKFKKYAKKAHLKFCRESCVNGKKFDNKMLYKMYTHKPQIVKKADITPIEVSIVMSHINAWMKILDSGEDYGMVIEDDAEIENQARKVVSDELNDQICQSILSQNRDGHFLNKKRVKFAKQVQDELVPKLFK